MATAQPATATSSESVIAHLRRFAREPEARWLAAIIAAATALRLVLLPTSAHLTEVFTDEFTFKRHVVLIHERGLIETFRDTNTSYVAYHYALWLLSLPYGWLGGAFDTSAMSLRILVKLPPLALDAALVVAVYAVARALWPRERATLAPLGAFHPVVVAGTSSGDAFGLGCGRWRRERLKRAQDHRGGEHGENRHQRHVVARLTGEDEVQRDPHRYR